MEEAQWPFILILSGVPSLADYVWEEEQLNHLLRPVHFDNIEFDRVPLGEGGDDAGEAFTGMEVLNQLGFALADSVGLDFEPLSTEDFLELLTFASFSRWGLATELFIEAFVACTLNGRTKVEIGDFVESYAGASGLPKAMSTFTASDYEEILDPAVFLDLLNKK